MKLFVWLVVLLETTQIAFNLAQVWHFTTSQKRDVVSMLGGTIVDVIAPLPAGCVALLCQTFLVHRAARLFRQPKTNALFHAAMAVPIGLSWAGSVLTCASAWVYVLKDEDSLGLISYNTALSIWLWPAAVTDVVVMVVLAIRLRKLLAGFNEGTDAVLRGLVSLSLQTGLPTAVLALTGAVVGNAFPSLDYATTNVPEAFWVALPGLYTLSLVTTLAARSTFRTELAGLAGQVEVKVEQRIDVEHRSDSHELQLAHRRPSDFEAGLVALREKRSGSVDTNATQTTTGGWSRRGTLPTVDLFRARPSIDEGSPTKTLVGSPHMHLGEAGRACARPDEDEDYSGRAGTETVLSVLSFVRAEPN